MKYNSFSTANDFEQVPLSEFIWEHILPWVYGKLFSLGWTFVSSMVSYSPFLLMTLIENKIEEHKVKGLHQAHIRAREDYAMEELSAYKEGDEMSEYVKQENRTEEEEDDEEDDEEEEESRQTTKS